ncbi:hypothetical protein LPUS_07942 [Lasallia pustulata]|uniref:Uncharacterized protein n=1 Tax=Lasallia pustulata TaxID=136370 RepID=A0A1W5D4M9_9LECA|nr:hypothetical protein LPUS_07942 [Lasallia pustulata]
MTSSPSNSQGRKRGSTSTWNSKPTTNTTSTKSTGPYSRAFQQNLIDHGVYLEGYEYPDGQVTPLPDNWDDINQRLVQPRRSLSPSQFSNEAVRKFKRANAHAFMEKQVTISVIPTIEGDIRDGRCVAGGIPFTNLDPLTDGTISPGSPDIFYGARPEQLNRGIRNELSGHIVPSTQKNLPMAPNFFLAAKGPDGSPAVAERQACYDGALGARGIHSLQSAGRAKPVYDKNAYTITSIYYSGTLKLYTSHLGQPTRPGGRPEYYMNQLNTWGMTGNPETFRQGATAYRNARDWTKEKRDGFIEAANGKARDTYTESQSLRSFSYGQASTPVAGLVLVDSDTSADELALYDEQIYTSPSKRPRREV